MIKVKKVLSLLLTLCFLVPFGACKQEEPFKELQCVQPPALSAMVPVGGTEAALCWTDYENNQTTLQLIDTAADTVRRTVTLTGAWSLKEQTLADGRLSLYNRETGTWKFFTADLEEMGFMTTENMDGYFSYDGNTYYYLNDHVLCRICVADGIQE